MIEPIDATFDLTGRKALVTGASRGIGEAIAIGLARFGADVAVTSRDVARLAEILAEIEAHGRRAVPVAMDAADVDAIRRGVGEAAAALDGLDLLVNNAGREEVCASLEVEEALWDRIHETNLKGAFFTAQAVARVMRGTGNGAKGGTILSFLVLDLGRGRAGGSTLWRFEGGPARLDPVASHRMGALGHSGQRHRARLFPDGADRDVLRRRGVAAGDAGEIPAGRFGDRRDLVGRPCFSSDAARATSRARSSMSTAATRRRSEAQPLRQPALSTVPATPAVPQPAWRRASHCSRPTPRRCRRSRPW